MRGWINHRTPRIAEPDFERMKVLARAAGFSIKTKAEAWRIIHLAHLFRGILRLSKIHPRGGRGESPE